MASETWIAGAIEALAGGADYVADSSVIVPRQKTGRASKSVATKTSPRALTDTGGHFASVALTSAAPRNPIEMAVTVAEPAFPAPSQPHSTRPTEDRKPGSSCRVEPEQSGHTTSENHHSDAALPPSGGRRGYEHHSCLATGTLIPRVVEEWRRRQDMLRARQRLELQAQAICRRYVDGDKVEAAKLWAAVKKDPAHDLRVWLQPFLSAISPIDSAKGEIEKTLTKLAKELPVYEWAKSVLGFGDMSLAAIVGECGIGPGEYRTVSALWKRMGLAVINGGRQRRIAGAEALEHGYNAERRSLMWNVGGSLIKAQLRSEKDDGKKIEGSEYSLGELGRVYLDRKAYLRERDPERSKAHIHNDAKRYMEKRLLRQLWQEWRRANVHLESSGGAPAADILEAT